MLYVANKCCMLLLQCCIYLGCRLNEICFDTASSTVGSVRAPQKPTQSPSSVSTSLPTKGDHATYQPEYGQPVPSVDTAEIYTASLPRGSAPQYSTCSLLRLNQTQSYPRTRTRNHGIVSLFLERRIRKRKGKNRAGRTWEGNGID